MNSVKRQPVPFKVVPYIFMIAVIASTTTNVFV
jgi:hypothetical protein